MRALLIVLMLSLVGFTHADAAMADETTKPKRKHKAKPPSEIIDGLWQGPRLKHGVYSEDYEVIVFGADEWQPKAKFYPGSEAVYARLSDIPKPTAKSFDEAVEAASEVADAIHEGKTVLVTCGQGYNRSGLVTALALIMLGYDTEEAIALIRERRGKSALRNRAFLRFVRAFVP